MAALIRKVLCANCVLHSQPIFPVFLTLTRSKGLLSWFAENITVTNDQVAWLQQPIDLSHEAFRRRFQKKELIANIEGQKLDAEKYERLGPDLNAAHFIVARGGSVKFTGRDRWYRQDPKTGNYFLPGRMMPNVFIEAIDASNTDLRFEGFSNFGDIELKWLSLENCVNIDDWCIAHLWRWRDSLMYLNVRGCPLVTECGLASLHQLRKLNHLVMDELPAVSHPPLVTILIEEMLPKCLVKGADYIAATEHTKTQRQLDEATAHSKIPDLLIREQSKVNVANNKEPKLLDGEVYGDVGKAIHSNAAEKQELESSVKEIRDDDTSVKESTSSQNAGKLHKRSIQR